MIEFDIGDPVVWCARRRCDRDTFRCDLIYFGLDGFSLVLHGGKSFSGGEAAGPMF